MTAVPFDTLKFAERLEAGGFTHPQAKAAAEAFAEAICQDMAPKSDIGEVELKIKGEIEASRADIIKWMFGAFVAQTGLLIAAFRLLH